MKFGQPDKAHTFGLRRFSTSLPEPHQRLSGSNQICGGKAQEHLSQANERHSRGDASRPSRTFRIAAPKYLQDYAQKKSIGDDAVQLKMLALMIGDSIFDKSTWTRCRPSSECGKRRRLARPEGETSNSSTAERLFAELVEWTEHLKDHALFRNAARVSS